jgi:hypothetical protein
MSTNCFALLGLVNIIVNVIASLLRLSNASELTFLVILDLFIVVAGTLGPVALIYWPSKE